MKKKRTTAKTQRIPSVRTYHCHGVSTIYATRSDRSFSIPRLSPDTLRATNFFTRLSFPFSFYFARQTKRNKTKRNETKGNGMKLAKEKRERETGLEIIRLTEHAFLEHAFTRGVTIINDRIFFEKQ